MRAVRLFEEVITRKEIIVGVPDEVSDEEAAEWAVDEVMYNLTENYATGKEDVIQDEFVDAELI